MARIPLAVPNANIKPTHRSSWPLALPRLAWKIIRLFRPLTRPIFWCLVALLVLGYFGLAKIPVITPIMYMPIEPDRIVTPDVWGGGNILTISHSSQPEITISEGQLTAWLIQVNHLLGGSTVYEPQAEITPAGVVITGRLFHANGFYRFIALSRPTIVAHRLHFDATSLRLQRVPLPAGVAQPLFDQLAGTINATLALAPMQTVSTEQQQLLITY